LVEDSRLLAMATEKALVRGGYSVMSASDGEEGLRMAYATVPDLILLEMFTAEACRTRVLHASE